MTDPTIIDQIVAVSGCSSDKVHHVLRILREQLREHGGQNTAIAANVIDNVMGQDGRMKGS